MRIIFAPGKCNFAWLNTPWGPQIQFGLFAIGIKVR